MTPVNTPDGGIGASVALRQSPQRRSDFCIDGMITAKGACPIRTAGRNLGGQFLESEVEMKEQVNIARVAGQRRLLRTIADGGCHIAWPAVVPSQFLNPVRISSQNE
jgi:hypothetical protein